MPAQVLPRPPPSLSPPSSPPNPTMPPYGLALGCAPVLDEHCWLHCPELGKNVVARYGYGARSPELPYCCGDNATWRCYARHTLDSSLSDYVRGPDYCTPPDGSLHASLRQCSGVSDAYTPVPLPTATSMIREDLGGGLQLLLRLLSASTSSTVTGVEPVAASLSLLLSVLLLLCLTRRGLDSRLTLVLLPSA